jgi:hypothetical protein
VLGLDKEVVASYLSSFTLPSLAAVQGRSVQHAYGFHP